MSSGYSHKIVFKGGRTANATSYNILSDGIIAYYIGLADNYTKYDKDGKSQFSFSKGYGMIDEIKGNFIVFKNDKKYFIFNNLINNWLKPNGHFISVKIRDFYVEAEYVEKNEPTTLLFDSKGNIMEKI